MRNQLLRDTDWSSMAHGLEVRVPFVDAKLLERMAPAIASAAPAIEAGPCSVRRTSSAGDARSRQDRVHHTGAALDRRSNRGFGARTARMGGERASIVPHGLAQ